MGSSEPEDVETVANCADGFEQQISELVNRRERAGRASEVPPADIDDEIERLQDDLAEVAWPVASA
jgi:hypothetical protein